MKEHVWEKNGLVICQEEKMKTFLNLNIKSKSVKIKHNITLLKTKPQKVKRNTIAD